MRKRTYSILGILAAAGTLAGAQGRNRSPQIGQLLNARGAITIERSGRVAVAEAHTCDRLREGDVVAVRAKSTVDIQISEVARRYRLASGSRVAVHLRGLNRISGPPIQTLPKMGPTLSRTVYTGTPAATLVRGGAEGPQMPRPEGAVTGSRVELRWSGTSVGEQTLRIRPRDGDHTVYRVSLEADVQTHQVPAGILRPGVWYVWAVADSAGHYCESAIRPVAQGDAAYIATLEREAEQARRAAPDDPTPDLLLAEAYESLGRYELAQVRYAAALKRRPDDSGLQHVYNRLSRPDKENP